MLDPELRMASMQVLVDVLSVYDKCLNDDLQEIDINDLLSEDALNHFRSYVFLN
jgi:hypothetical protein